MTAIVASPHACLPARPRAASLAAALLLVAVGGLSLAEQPRLSPHAVRLTITLDGGPGADTLVVDGQIGRVAVGDSLDGAVRLVDDRDGRLLRTIGLGAAVASQALAVDTRVHHLFVVGQAGGGSGGHVWTLDMRTGALLQVTRLAGVVTAIGVDEDSGRVVVADDEGARVAILDTRTGHVLHSAGIGLIPLATTVVGSGGRAYVVAGGSYHAGHLYGEGMVSVLDIRRGAVVRTVRVSESPQALAIDDARGLVLVAADGPLDAQGLPVGPGVVDALDAGSGAVVRTVGVGVAPRAIAVDARNGRAIILNSGGVVDTPSGWATGWALRVRRWLPWAPMSPPDPTPGHAPASVTILDLQAMR